VGHDVEAWRRRSTPRWLGVLPRWWPGFATLSPSRAFAVAVPPSRGCDVEAASRFCRSPRLDTAKESAATISPSRAFEVAVPPSRG